MYRAPRRGSQEADTSCQRDEKAWLEYTDQARVEESHRENTNNMSSYQGTHSKRNRARNIPARIPRSPDVDIGCRGRETSRNGPLIEAARGRRGLCMRRARVRAILT